MRTAATVQRSLLIRDVDYNRHILHFMTAHGNCAGMSKFQVKMITMFHGTEIKIVVFIFGIKRMKIVVILMDNLNCVTHLGRYFCM